MKILYTTSNNRLEEQVEARKAVRRLAPYYDIDVQLCDGPHDYWTILMNYWGEADLIIVEQDIVLTAEHIKAFEQCEFEGPCCIPYILGDGRWSIYHYPKGFRPDGLPYNMVFYDKPWPMFADGSSLGLTKIPKYVQELTKDKMLSYPVKQFRWTYMDTWLGSYLCNVLKIPFHVHEMDVKHGGANRFPRFFATQKPEIIDLRRQENSDKHRLR